MKAGPHCEKPLKLFKKKKIILQSLTALMFLEWSFFILLFREHTHSETLWKASSSSWSLHKILFPLITLPSSLRNSLAVLIHWQVQAPALQKTKGSDQNWLARRFHEEVSLLLQILPYAFSRPQNQLALSASLSLAESIPVGQSTPPEHRFSFPAHSANGTGLVWF